MRRLSREQRRKILNLLVEGNSLRSTSRLTGHSLKTVIRLMAEAGQACNAWHHENVRGVRARRVQADEIWSFVYCKERTVEYARRPPIGAGDIWTWTAMDVDSKLLISWLLGPREQAEAARLMRDLAGRLAGRVQLTTDGLHHYLPAVRAAFGDNIDYAQLVKSFRRSRRDPVVTEVEMNPERKYSPPRIFSSTKAEIQGTPDEAHISTSMAERHNLTFRMQNRRFTRLTNAFSKTLVNHGRQIALFVTWYNWVRIHKTIRMTPAMAAGLDAAPRDLDWLVSLVEARDSQPAARR
ncbi:MAG: IS1 family transposase [Gammaproteobacteria bacterium]|nr:IS1 family transposase [Gammaproteobacteria bacterium]